MEPNTTELPEDDAIPARLSGLPATYMLGLVLSGLLCVGSLAWGLDVYREIGMSFMNEQFKAGMLALAMPAVFLLFRASGASQPAPAPLYDLAIAAATAGAAGYLALYYPFILDRLYQAPTDAVIAASILILGIAEGLRRTAGRTLFFFLVFFLLFGFYSHYMPFAIRGEQTDFSRYVVFLGIDINGLFGFALHVATTMIVAFLLFGFVLEKSGGAAFFTDFSKALVGRKRGGAAKIAVIASGLFGSISGSAVSNVVSTGVVTIPLMRKSGYTRETAAGVEAVASTGGQLMPPLMGIAAFLIAETLQKPYAAVVVAAIIPALMYFWAIFVHVDLLAVKNNIKPLSGADIPRLRSLSLKDFLFFVPFVVIVYGLFFLFLPPETAAIYATVSIIPIGLFLGYKGEKLRVRDTIPLLMRTGKAALEILMISAAAGIIIGVLNISGLGFALTLELAVFLGDAVVVLLIVVAILSIILGMGMPTVGVYLLLATLLAPAIVEVGIPDLSAHLFVFYFGLMSLVTPPVAIAAFTAATVARADSVKTAIAAVRVGWVAYFIPFLIVTSPVFIMQGSWLHIGLSFVTALVGIWFVTSAMVGFANAQLTPVLRLAFASSGLLLLVPTDIGTLSMATNVAGLALGVLSYLVAGHSSPAAEDLETEER